MDATCDRDSVSVSEFHLCVTEGVKDIACGERHSLLLDDAGNLYAFGENLAGQCHVRYKTVSAQGSNLCELIDLLIFLICSDYLKINVSCWIMLDSSQLGSSSLQEHCCSQDSMQTRH